MRRTSGPLPVFSLILLLLSTMALTGKTQTLKLPQVTRTRLPGGTEIALMEYRRAPLLTLIVRFPGGDVTDPKGKEGVTELMATLLKRGTQKRTATQLAEEIEFLGGFLFAGTGSEAVTVSLDVLAKDADAGMELLADILRNPTFPMEELDRERELAISGLQSLGEDPGAVATRVANEILYAGHPYGAAPTITSLKAITREDILAAYRLLITPARMQVVAVGDFKASAMSEKIRGLFNGWEGSKEPLPVLPPVSPSQPRRILIDKPDATQVQVRLIRPGFARLSPEYFPAQLANAIMGDGFTSRLTNEIRVNRSLTYGIGSRFGTLKKGGDVRISTFTKLETGGEILSVTRNELRKAASKGFTAEELRKVKGYLPGMYAAGAQTTQQLAGLLSAVVANGLPTGYLSTYLTKLERVPLSEVNRIAATYYNPDNYSIILVAPAAKVQNQLRTLGTFETRSVESVGK